MKTYRVIQWATGTVGKASIRHFVENPAFELAGVFVTNPEKVGRDAGELAGIAATGVIATDDVDAILALDADCVHFAPAVNDIPMVCRLLRAGKNVVSPIGPHFLTDYSRADWEAVDAAAREGSVSFHGCGIHPGYAGDILPLTLTRLMERIDHIHIYEVANQLENPSHYIEFMGFGREPADLLANPGRSPEAPLMFAQSMAIVVESLGTKIDRLVTKFEVAAATQDIDYGLGVVRKGTVAGQHYEWTAICEGRPLITFHCFWMLGDKMEPLWDCGGSGYRVRFEGNPAMEMALTRPDPRADARSGFSWTAMAGINAIVAVCEASPGAVTHLDLGLFGPPGLIRPR